MWSWLRRTWARLLYRRFAADLAEELQTHRAMLEDDLAARGLTADDARDAARVALGNDLQAREDARAVWLAPWIDQTVQDVRFAWRQLRRAPAFSVTALLLSGLGVGATTAVFSVVNALLIVPLPYPDAARVYALATPSGGGVDGETFHAVLARTTVFSAVAAQRQTGGWSLVAGAHAESVAALRVSAHYFDVLGTPPPMGRPFSAGEDAPGGADVVVISDAVWQRAFGKASDVVGRQVVLGSVPHTIIGVMPDSFRSTPPVDVWTPLRLSPRDNSVNYLVLGRLRTGVDVGQATAELEVVKSDLMAQQVAQLHQRTRSLTWMPLSRFLGFELALPLLLLLLAVAATSAVAAANLTGLLLFRTLAREREVATRLALGASRGRVVRQFLTESFVLATLGGGLGVTVAVWLMPALTQAMPAALLVGRDVQLDLSVMAVAVGTIVVVGLVFGLTPTLTVRRFDLRAVSGHRRVAFGANRSMWARRLLLGSEMACTATLLVLGGMLGQTLAQMYRADLGLDPAQVTVGRMSLSGVAAAEPHRFPGFVDRALGALKAIPGVEAAALANSVPIARGLNIPVDPSTGSLVASVRSVDWRYVSSDYFAVLGMAMRRGRAFDDRDRDGGAPTAIVNEAFARAYFGRDDVLSETLFMEASVKDMPRTIVGVVQDSRSGPGSGWTRGINARGADAPPIVYVPLAQAPPRILSATHQSFPAAWIVRTRPGTGDIGAAVDEAVRRIEPSLAFVNIQPLSQVVEADVQGPKALTAVIGVLAMLSLGVAVTGIVGLVAYGTAVRRRETAVRTALGASRASLVRSFVGETIAVVVVGTAAGLVVALGASRALQAMVGTLAAIEPLTALFAASLLVVAVCTAAAWPAFKASGVDPLLALRVD